jgi:hypothetical protein
MSRHRPEVQLSSECRCQRDRARRALLFTTFVEATAAIESAASAIYIESLLKTSIAIRSSSSEIGFGPDYFGVRARRWLACPCRSLRFSVRAWPDSKGSNWVSPRALPSAHPFSERPVCRDLRGQSLSGNAGSSTNKKSYFHGASQTMMQRSCLGIPSASALARKCGRAATYSQRVPHARMAQNAAQDRGPATGLSWRFLRPVVVTRFNAVKSLVMIVMRTRGDAVVASPMAL